MTPVLGDRCDRSQIDPFLVDRSLEGLSTGCFDPDREDLSCDGVLKVGSPGGGFGPNGVAIKPWPKPEPHTYHPNPRDGIWRGWNGESSGCRSQPSNQLFPEIFDWEPSCLLVSDLPPDDDRDKTGAGSPEGESSSRLITDDPAGSS